MRIAFNDYDLFVRMCEYTFLYFDSLNGGHEDIEDDS